MKNIKIIALLVVLILFCSYLSAQSSQLYHPLIDNAILNWQQAGHQGDIPIEDHVINVSFYWRIQ